MHDMFVKLTREELSSRTLVKLTQVKLNEYRGFIHSILASLVKSPESSIFLERMISNIMKDAELWVRFRLAKLILGASAPSETFDTLFIEALFNMLNKYVSIVNGLNITYGDEVLVRYSKEAHLLRGSRKKGDYEFVKLEDLLGFMSSNVYDTVPFLTVKYLGRRGEISISQRKL